MHYGPGFNRLRTDGSSTEDFRSVIDDLTIANKKLKNKLKKYEMRHGAHLQDEKLFEVRFHGLSDDKKKELEEMLRRFAGELDASPDSIHPTASSRIPGLHTHKTQKTNSTFAESGYASMSASGQNSMSAPSGQDNKSRRISRSQYNRQQQTIQSYLHDIPQGLLPNPDVQMTDKSKKQLVVLRLEQIFAGKRPGPGIHSQPLQQEEVAQSAAQADRHAREAKGQYKKEGLREAHIMAEEDDDMTSAPTESLQKLRPNLQVNEQDFAGSHSPDQRPTRPLDLDILRAQVPAENMEYFRHLGFSPPDMISQYASAEGHGWLYLNLLINMAQLHTLHVTPDFVQDAIKTYSRKLELSADGRRIRWKGGYELTRNGDSSSEQLSGTSPIDTDYASNSNSPYKRTKMGHNGVSSEHLDHKTHALRLARAAKEKEKNKLAYVPLFHRNQSSQDGDDDYSQDLASSSASPLLAHQHGNSPELGGSAIRSLPSHKRREDGPMIFYTKAKFFMDLTGDRRGLSFANPATHTNLGAQPLGMASTSAHFPAIPEIEETRGPLDATSMDLVAQDDERTILSEGEGGFTPWPMQHDAGSETPAIMDLVASGIGGVHPDDNFAINVKRTHMRTEHSLASQETAKRSLLYPKKILDALNEPQISEGQSTRPSQSIIKEEIVSASCRTLPSSTLPPASFLPFDSTSSGEADSDLESDASSGAYSMESSSQDLVTVLQEIGPSLSDHEEIDEEESSSEISEAETDESVDLLATARKLDPQTVLASEREYDATLADRLAEEIPAGSSAATAAGGSPCNSPDNTMHPGIAPGGSNPMSLKRARTSDSFYQAAHSKKVGERK
jgi:hypothetical protein